MRACCEPTCPIRRDRHPSRRTTRRTASRRPASCSPEHAWLLVRGSHAESSFLSPSHSLLPPGPPSMEHKSSAPHERILSSLTRLSKVLPLSLYFIPLYFIPVFYSCILFPSSSLYFFFSSCDDRLLFVLNMLESARIGLEYLTN